MSETHPSTPRDFTFGPRERLAAALFAIPALAALSLLPLAPPEVVEENAPTTEFSAARARHHLEAITVEPHPMGTPAHARVREYLVGQIEALGLEAVVQTATTTHPFRGRFPIARVHNVLTRLPGSAGNNTLLFVAHYDSVDISPGASDDGSGVVTLLETLRALKASEPLQNDVIFLFADGEEKGLVGAHAFQHQHPWAKDVDLVLNFEARGSGGPSIMFETGPRTSSLIRRLAKVAPHPVAFSYSSDVYRLLGNDTDFSIFKEQNLPGFNFAYISNVRAYHASLDTLEALDLRSVQHHGSYALSLAREFGGTDLTDLPQQPEKIFFNLPFLGLVVYSTSTALPLAALCALLTLAVLVHGFRRGRLTLGRLLLGLLLFVVSLVAIVASVTFLSQGLLNLLARSGALANPAMYRFGLSLFGVGIATGLTAIFGRKLGVAHLAAGACLAWLGLTLFAAFSLQSSSYLLVWPLVFGLLTLLLVVRTPAEGPTRFLTGLGLIALAIPAIWLWAPMFSLLGAAFGIDSAIFLGALAALVTSILQPQIALLLGNQRSVLPVALLVLGLGFALVQCQTAGFDAQRPQHHSLFYALDTESGNAQWVTTDGAVNPWTALYLGDNPQRTTLSDYFIFGDWTLLSQSAPVLAVPQLEVIDLDAIPEPAALETDSPVEEQDPAESTPGKRLLRLLIRPTGPATRTYFRILAEDSFSRLEVDGLSIDLVAAKRPAGAPAGYWRGEFIGDPGDGFEMTVEIDGPSPIRFESVTMGAGLPVDPDNPRPPRPANLRPTPGWYTDLSMTKKNYIF